MQINEKGETFISKYSGELSQSELAKNLAKIKTAFPALQAEFLKLLTDRIIEKNFSDDRLIDSVNHVIENCIYPSPTIANFLSYDKKIRLYTYPEMIEKVNTGGATVWQYYDKKEINGIIYWYEKSEKF